MTQLTIPNDKVQNLKTQSSGIMTTIGIFFFVGILITTIASPAPRDPFKPKDSTIGQQIQVQAETKEEVVETKKEEPKGEELPTTEPVKELGYNESEGNSIKVEELKTSKKSKIKNDCASPNKNLEKAINQVAIEAGLDCRYLITLAKIESGENPNSKNTGCSYYKVYKQTICEKSYGAFMINLDAHKKFVTKEQALNPLFATRWASKRIVGQYGGKPDADGKIKGWIGVLGCHQGKWGTQCGSNNYRSKIEKIGISVGLQY